jgi:hypothetical protein
VLGGRFAQAAYRMQLMPLLGDAQAQTLKGLTGDLARSPWRWQFEPSQIEPKDEAVALISEGVLTPMAAAPAAASSAAAPDTESTPT